MRGILSPAPAEAKNLILPDNAIEAVLALAGAAFGLIRFRSPFAAVALAYGASKWTFPTVLGIGAWEGYKRTSPSF